MQAPGTVSGGNSDMLPVAEKDEEGEGEGEGEGVVKGGEERIPVVLWFGGALDLMAVLNFVDSEHDLIVAADANSSYLIRKIAAECGVDFDEDPSAMVIDHTSYAVSETEGNHTFIASDDLIKSEVILGNKNIEAPVLFKGIGHSLNLENSLVLKVLSASSTAYSANPKFNLASPPSLVGSSIT